MRALADIELVPAWVPQDAPFAEAVTELLERSVRMIAVLEGERRVVGLFGGEEFLRGLFPRYLGELHHTAFAGDDPVVLASHAEAVRAEPVARHMVKAVTVEVDSSPLHVAELFLHSRLLALPVVEGERFVGMLDRVEFARAMLRRSGAFPAP